MCVSALLWGWILLVWPTRLIARVVVLSTHSQLKQRAWHGCHHWLVVAAALLVADQALRHDMPFRAAFAVSRLQLDRLAYEVMTTQQEQGQQWAGVIPIRSARPIPGGMEFTIDQKQIPWGRRGFYFSSTGAPLAASHYYDQQPIDAGWHSWHYGGW